MAGETDPVVGDTSPCVGCGMCCNGTIYWIAKVTPGEERRIEGYGLQLTQEKDTTYFRLPCHHEKCGRCTIYEERFDICRSFRCKLLRNYQSGEVDLGEAHRRVETALKLVELVTSDEPAAGSAFARREIRAGLAVAPDGETVSERGERARRLLNIVALDTYLERWFRNPKAGTDKDQPETSPANS
jgi:uncharacterized protein